MKRVLRSKKKKLALTIVYKKTDEWYIEWQRVTTSYTTSENEWYNEWQRVVQPVATNGNEWQPVVKQVVTNDSEWQRVVQRVTTIDYDWQKVVQRVAKSENEWQRVTTNGNEWDQVRAVVQRIKTAQYTSKNGWLPSFQWQKEIHYYFKGWVAAIRVVKGALMQIWKSLYII